MAFLIPDAQLFGYKVLNTKSGKSDKGKAWAQVDLFKDGSTISASSTDPVVMAAINNLKELQEVDCIVRAVAGKDRSYVVLTGIAEAGTGAVVL